MTQEEKLVWRLSKLPSVEELLSLVKDKIITQEEAKEILFSLEKKEDRVDYSLQDEIKFLREVVEKLSRNRNEIVETIRYVEKPYLKYDWYKPYYTWSNVSEVTLCSNAQTATLGCINTISNDGLELDDNPNFTSIKTF